jgi:hypothetical protein
MLQKGWLGLVWDSEEWCIAWFWDGGLCDWVLAFSCLGLVCFLVLGHGNDDDAMQGTLYD